MNQQTGEETEITGINVTPLVDVMLVLLIIFMMTTSYIVNRSLNIQIPEAETSESLSTTKNLALALDKESQLYIDGEPTNYEDLGNHIAKAKEKNKLLQALITADKTTPHGAVIKLIDQVRKNGITEFAINVNSPQNTEEKAKK